MPKPRKSAERGRAKVFGDGYSAGHYCAWFDAVRQIVIGAGPVVFLEAVTGVFKDHHHEAFGDVTSEGEELVGQVVGLLNGAHQRAIKVAAVYTVAEGVKKKKGQKKS